MITIRNATAGDAQVIQEILNTSWFATYKHIFTEDELIKLTTKWHNVDKISKQLLGKKYTYLLAENENIIVGICSGYLLNKNHLSIEKLHILPNYKGLGIGSMLLNELVQRFKKVSVLELEVVKQNIQAIKFYEKHGFTKTKEIEFIVNGVKVPCYVMEKHL